jgi:membrane protein YqaA with SNARE-associated domain
MIVVATCRGVRLPAKLRGSLEMAFDLAVYGGLFLAAFAAATMLPMQSEALLVALLLADHSPWLLVAVASAGNILGSVVNWLLGRGIEHFAGQRWFPARGTGWERAQRWYARYGKWSLLLSWAPIVGDSLTLIAGALREPLGTFLLLVAIAKIGRYVVVAVATIGMV